MAGLKVEPSAAASASGARALLGTEAGRNYLQTHGLQALLPQANHVLWTTGGALMPTDEYDALLIAGEEADRRLAA